MENRYTAAVITVSDKGFAGSGRIPPDRPSSSCSERTATKS